jgi:CRISPR-associated endonuclease/helicase Cas3
MKPTSMLISHPAEKNLKEKPLTEHLRGVAELSQQGLAALRLDLSLITKTQLQRLSFLIGLFHDFGKATPYFQVYIRSKDKKADQNTRHGFLSALAGYFFIEKELQSNLLSYTAFQVIKNHHGNLEAFDASNDRNIKKNVRTARMQLEKCLENYYDELRDFYLPYIPHFDTIRDIDADRMIEIVETSDRLIEDCLGDDQDKRIELFFITNLLFSL